MAGGVAAGRTGSIPANAGEPPPYTYNLVGIRVYPRERGGTLDDAKTAPTEQGLSPRTRGNQAKRRPRHRPPGSIPANAGEPPSAASSPSWVRVYPRERGGTHRHDPATSPGLGLSPRTRGNRGGVCSGGAWGGSIPANAGEPLTGPNGKCGGTVYPRERGGTDGAVKDSQVFGGLSPRTRGNRLGRRRCALVRGSIPANAGEP